MRRLISLCLLIVYALTLMASGCSVPDDENYNTIVAGINSLPAATASQLARWQSASKTYNFLCRKDLREDKPDDVLVWIVCRDAHGEIPTQFAGQRSPVTPLDVLTRESICGCIDRGKGELVQDPRFDASYRTFFDCILGAAFEAANLADSIRWQENLDGGDIDCQPYITMGIPEKELENWGPKAQTAERNADALISSPTIPQWAVVLGLIVVGGVVVSVAAPYAAPIRVALCALREGNGCPTDPNYAPGQTPQPDRSSP